MTVVYEALELIMSNGLTFEAVARTFLAYLHAVSSLELCKYCPAKFTETRYFSEKSTQITNFIFY